MEKKTKKTVKTIDPIAEKKVVVSAPVSAKIYNTEGKEKGALDLPNNLFGLKWNADLVHQVVSSMISSARTVIADTKGRGEVRGGGKKPWQQKGTGRARHGSSRSPIWKGGGATHGPHAERNYDKKVNKKMKAKALFTIISKKIRDNEVFFLDNLKATAPKAKEGLAILKNLTKIKGAEMILAKKANSAYITVMKNDENLNKSFRNFGNIKIDEWRNINPLDVLNYRYLIIDNVEAAAKFLANKMK